ncbi:DNA adenine methylase [Deinococcus peraridilitoris]|uniref:site-specific DNA-methyltransferase (adenine-specific) n=1 Tax=Deinococcus peraridilitoris (strain DSM 19664 / LMG 22246 / CIP 109416 / KR-200) TaxID=937777 RepID=K9ZZV5_DEIPD|nr:DNA adenine methylase [Deinococcus peraridilitoris]AFZ67111.1 site-specific DNA methylase [Deinococcus peraridilitoris DSM 19664]
MTATTYRAPFPYFGGKSKVAARVWERFGDVGNYVEPFFGSGAVLLGRPHSPRTETVNDLDGFICNFWRAVLADPEGVAAWADHPVNELDLHARHAWLVAQRERLTTQLREDPDAFDAKVAGWWVWGISQWIGSGWCTQPKWEGRASAQRERIWFSPHCLPPVRVRSVQHDLFGGES